MKYPFLVLVVLLAGCAKPAADSLPGYVEADLVRVAAPFAGRLLNLAVARGAEVSAGAPLFALERDNESLAVDQATALLAQSEAQSANLDKGKRRDELAALAAQIEAAQANLKLAESDLARQRDLAARGFASPATLDSVAQRVQANRAALEQAQANLRAADLAARSDERAAARAGVRAAQARLGQSNWQLAQMSVASPRKGRVEDTLYQPGEMVPAGSPVVSLLAPEDIKLRFFVPQAQLSAVRPGSVVTVNCDGCGKPFPATVSFVASEAEFTPPVIYSLQNRARLVFMVEARPQQPGTLRPGQPVDVQLGAAQ